MVPYFHMDSYLFRYYRSEILGINSGILQLSLYGDKDLDFYGGRVDYKVLN